MNRDQQKQPKQPVKTKTRHDPARTAANKARRIARAEKQRSVDRAKQIDHGASRFHNRAKLKFLPPVAAKAVKRRMKHAANATAIHFIPERAMFQLGVRARLVGG